MDKTLTINIYQDPTQHIEKFLNDWQQFGHYEHNADLSYLLIGKNNRQSILTMYHNKITIQGNIPSETFMVIDRLAKACEADKVVEGEVIDEYPHHSARSQHGFEQTFRKGNSNFQSAFSINGIPNISTLSKTKLIVLLILAIPVLLITIPIIIVVAIIKIIRFKLNLK